jgi:hypothetical protein
VRGAEQWVQNRIRGRRGGGPEAELALDGGFGREELLTWLPSFLFNQMGTPRIATDIRIGTRTDKQIADGQGNLGKVSRVEGILAKDQAGN